MRMRSPLFGLQAWSFPKVWLQVCEPSCEQQRLWLDCAYKCAGSLGPLLLACVISTLFSRAGSNREKRPDQTVQLHRLIWHCTVRTWRKGSSLTWTSTIHTVAHNSPSRHMTFIQRRLNVDATSWRCIDVEQTLYKRHVPAGQKLNGGWHFIHNLCGPYVHDYVHVHGSSAEISSPWTMKA